MTKTAETSEPADAAGRLDWLVIKLLGNDDKVDELLSNLNQIATDVDSYEYGLPLYADGSKELLRKAVIKWIAGL